MRYKLLILTLLLSGSLMAQQPPPGRMLRQGAPDVTALKDAVGLTDAQVTQLIQIAKDRNTATRPIRSQIAEKQRALRDAVKAGDTALVGQLQLDLASLNKQLQGIEAQYIGRARAVLDSTQLSKLKAIEDAAKLMPAVREAVGLNLIEGPGPGIGPGRMGFGGPGGMMSRPGRPGPQ